MITYKYEGEDNMYERITFLHDELSELHEKRYSDSDLMITVDLDNFAVVVGIDQYEGVGNSLDNAIKDLIGDYENTHIEDYIKLYEEDMIEMELNQKLYEEKEEI